MELDERQRAMLQEMGVRVWLPEPVQLADAASVPSTAAEPRTPTDRAPVVAEVVGSARQPTARAPAATSAMARDTAPLDAALAAQVGATGQALALQDLDGVALAACASTCQACGLCAGRKNATLQAPTSPLQADWFVVGDPPDEDEDRLGQPFVEQAGLLLDNMLKAAGASRGGVARQGAYLSNVVKCRPPMGRLPQPSELAQCAHYLQREIELVQPKLILAMGRFATQLLLQEHPEQAALPLGKQRGLVYQYRGIPVVVTYHPKVLLRASADKAKAWADLCMAMDVLEG